MKRIPPKEHLDRLIYGRVRDSYNMFQNGTTGRAPGLQKEFTDVKIFDEIDSWEGKDVLVVSNYDVAYRLFLNRNLNKGLELNGKEFTTKYDYKSLTLVTDILFRDEDFKEVDPFSGYDVTVVTWPLTHIESCPIEGRFDVVFFNNSGSFNAADTKKIEAKCNEWSK